MTFPSDLEIAKRAALVAIALMIAFQELVLR